MTKEKEIFKTDTKTGRGDFLRIYDYSGFLCFDMEDTYEFLHTELVLEEVKKLRNAICRWIREQENDYR